jgi:hypothetical protein
MRYLASLLTILTILCLLSVNDGETSMITAASTVTAGTVSRSSMPETEPGVHLSGADFVLTQGARGQTSVYSSAYSTIFPTSEGGNVNLSATLGITPAYCTGPSPCGAYTGSMLTFQGVQYPASTHGPGEGTLNFFGPSVRVPATSVSGPHTVSVSAPFTFSGTVYGLDTPYLSRVLALDLTGQGTATAFFATFPSASGGSYYFSGITYTFSDVSSIPAAPTGPQSRSVPIPVTGLLDLRQQLLQLKRDWGVSADQSLSLASGGILGGTSTTPIVNPEPSTMLLLSSGLLGLRLWQRRRREA